MKTVLRSVGIALVCLLLLVAGRLGTALLDTSILPVEMEDVYGSYRFENKVLVLHRNMTYEYFTKCYPHPGCVPISGRWDFCPDEDAPAVRLHGYHRSDQGTRDQEKYLQRLLKDWGAVTIRETETTEYVKLPESERRPGDP